MAFSASFSITPTANASTFVLEDTSTGSDAGLTGRTIYVYQASGQLLVSPIAWAIGDNTISLDILEQDYGLNVRVDWASSSPIPGSTYTYSLIYAFVKYGQQFIYNLTQYQQSNPSVVQDGNWYVNKLTVLCLILSAQNAIDTGEDLFGAQSCISLYQAYINNQQYYFGNVIN